MADEVDDEGVSVESVCLSTQDDCLTTDSSNTHTISIAQFSPEELYKHALQFYKGTGMALDR